ncbi:MAG: PEP/pyruvate-binding domain-containing protein [Acidobacteriota bacterium]
MLKKLNIFKRWTARGAQPSRDDLSAIFRVKYERFKELLDSNAELSKIIADMEEKLQGGQVFGMSYVRSQSARAVFHAIRMIKSLNGLSGNHYMDLFEVIEGINGRIKDELGSRKENPVQEIVLPYSRITAEQVDWVGGKSANLGEVLNRANLPIPEGFAVTTRAFDLLLAENDLRDEINRVTMEMDQKDPESVNEASEAIQRLILSTPIPEAVREAMLGAYDEMASRIGKEPQVSLRSSAIGEDSELSYAGQYLSLLNVSRDRLVQSYSYIVASLFTPRAISYRLNKGIRDEDIAMSVACLRMVESRASGVAYSRHPVNLLDDAAVITGVWGLGPYAVDGVVTPDSFSVARDESFSIKKSTIADKPVQLVMNPDGGLIEQEVPPEDRSRSCITPQQVSILAEYVLKLEKHYGCPQDMEWALDADGNLLVLQTRPLRLEGSPVVGALKTFTPAEITITSPPLIENATVAYPGVGFGRAHQIHSEDDLLNFPDGAVLIAKHSSPKFVIVMPKAQAIITDSGSVTGHMASLSREFEVPTILDARSAMASIPTGTEVTVDAFSGRVYTGRVEELLNLRVNRESTIKDTPVFRTLRKVADLILPLRLVDPRSPEFSPGYCRSLHDVMRFVHEHSYKEMFQISDQVSDCVGCSVKLHAPIPFDLHIIDLGGGLTGVSSHASSINTDKVSSIPFKALLKGMLHEDLRYHRPRPVALRGFMSVMSEQMLTPTHSGGERFGDRSYAIVSDKYLNFSSRVGYHYSVLDSYCGQTVNKNYITFSFKGGAADGQRRNRRARAIAMILEALDFTVEVVADRVDARYQKYGMEVTEEKLDMLGRLLLFTRQMDMLMNTEETIHVVAKAFIEGNYHLEAIR